MGESVSEGVILEWAKQPDDAVAEDATLVEISTDAVAAEVPSPASGTLTEILARAGRRPPRLVHAPDRVRIARAPTSRCR